MAAQGRELEQQLAQAAGGEDTLIFFKYSQSLLVAVSRPVPYGTALAERPQEIGHAIRAPGLGAMSGT